MKKYIRSTTDYDSIDASMFSQLHDICEPAISIIDNYCNAFGFSYNIVEKSEHPEGFISGADYYSISVRVKLPRKKPISVLFCDFKNNLDSSNVLNVFIPFASGSEVFRNLDFDGEQIFDLPTLSSKFLQQYESKLESKLSSIAIDKETTKQLSNKKLYELVKQQAEYVEVDDNSTVHDIFDTLQNLIGDKFQLSDKQYDLIFKWIQQGEFDELYSEREYDE